MNRLRACYCLMTNPYNQQIYKVDLSPDVVDGFVFWTKNIGPFVKYLPEIKERGYPFIVQHTINGYPRELEHRVINYSHTIEHMKRLANEYGSEVAVWRYDPIVFSNLTPKDWHLQNFEGLAKALQGTTDEVVVSIAQIYKKTRRNMDREAQKSGLSWMDPEIMPIEQRRSLLIDLAGIASSYSMQLKVCSQKTFLISGVIEEARCVDADRLEKVSHKPIIDKAKQKGNRKECGCFASKDIGEYDTCPHGCIYCYAVQERDLALQRNKEHDPQGEFLFPPRNYAVLKDEEVQTSALIAASEIHKKEAKESPFRQEKLF